MKRWLPWVLLLVSLGLNAGYFGTLAVRKLRGEPAATPAAPPAALERVTGGGREPGEMAPERIARLADRLGLSGDARRAFIESQRTFVRRVVVQRAEVARLQAELRREASAETPDQEQLERLVRELGEAYAELDRSFVRNVLESRQHLDPEQLRVFRQMLKRLRARASSAPGRR